MTERGLHEESRAALAEIARLAPAGARVVFVTGNFNVVHPGHLRLLRFAAECGDFLAVGVHDERQDGAHVPEALRLEAVRSISFVNYAFILRDPAPALIATLRPAAVVKGKEHEAGPNPEHPVLEAYGGKLLFGSGEVRFSSLDLLKREFEEFSPSSIRLPTEYMKRHAFVPNDLRQLLRRFRGMRVTVAGDLIVDEYVNCEPLGLSQEDPTIVVSPIRQDRFLGGAAIVAAHASRLGADVRLFTVGGRDPVAEFAARHLAEYRVKATILEDESRPTTLKQRFRADGKTLLRVSHLRQHDVAHSLAERLGAELRAALAGSDLLIFSDFNYGCLTQGVVDEVSRAGARGAVPMVADSQSSSQIGDVSRFRDMLLLTPTEREARLAMRDFGSGLVVLADSLRSKARAKYMAVTLGPEGVLGHAGSDGAGSMVTDQLPAFNTAPKDQAGAGDSFLVCSAMALVAGADFWRSIFLGSIAAACQVGRVGNLPLAPKDLEAEL